MSSRRVRTVVTPEPQPGTGILHPFPTAELAHLDPFVFLDTGAPRDLGGASIYVGPHPHRGVQPVSLVFRARIEHRDSLGNQRTVESGGMQWLVAGAGAMHEEVLYGDAAGVFHMAQLWVNVAADRKMDPPEHHAIDADRVPLITDLGPGTAVRLFAGTVGDHRGPAPLSTPVIVAHAAIQAGGRLAVPVPAGWTAALCVVAGAVDVDDHEGLGPGATPVFEDDGDSISAASMTGGEVLVMSGAPIGEPIAMGGGFVMNTPEEIDQAFRDHRSGRMGQLTASR